MTLRRLALCGSLLLVLCSSSGCGMMRMRYSDVPRVDPWPIAERLDIGVDPRGGLQISGIAERPTALVRISLDGIAEDLQNESDPFLNLREFRAPFHAGLFSAVTYQYGTDFKKVEADIILDVLLRRRQETGWYTVVGACTLGALPFVVFQEFSVECTVLDRDDVALGTISKSDGLSDIFWLPFLPLNIVFSGIDLLGLGTSLGLSTSGWEEKEKATLENMMRAVVVDVYGLMKDAATPASPEEPDEPSGD